MDGDAFTAWANARPPHVRDVALRFPPGTSFVVDGHQLWVIGYSETTGTRVMLRLSPINPGRDYDAALAAEPIYICSDHFAIDGTTSLGPR